MVASWLPLLVPFAGLATPAVGLEYTCGDLKAYFNSEGCCGMPEKELSKTPAEAACPYSFAKPACANAEPQSPRDLTANAPGQKVPKAAVLNEEQAAFMPLTNVHYHLGAEHKSEAYSDGTDGEAYDADQDGRRLGYGGEVRPGFMCPTSDLSSTQLESYSFEHCTGDVTVGKSYEVHYVHSSAGYSEEVRNSIYESLGSRRISEAAVMTVKLESEHVFNHHPARFVLRVPNYTWRLGSRIHDPARMKLHQRQTRHWA